MLLLAHVARATREAPLLLLGTYRDVEVQEDDVLSLCLAELRRARLLRSLPLRGLAADEVANLIQQSGTTLDPDLLRTVAERLTHTLRSFTGRYASVMVARFGGDEFVISVRHAQARDVGLEIAAACSAAFEEPIVHDSLEFYSAPSIGVAVFPDDGADVTTVLKHADTAMYHAKDKSQPSYAIFDPRMNAPAAERKELAESLQSALAEGPVNATDCSVKEIHDKFLATDQSFASLLREIALSKTLSVRGAGP